MSQITTPEGLIKPEVQLSGGGGDALILIGKVEDALRRAGNPPEVVDAFRAEAFSGDYDHVLQTCMTYADVS